MKAVLEYDLPEEIDEFEIAVNSRKYYNIIFDYKMFLRGKLKYEDLSEQEYEIIEKIREKFFSIIEENGINLGEF